MHISMLSLCVYDDLYKMYPDVCRRLRENEKGRVCRHGAL